MKYPKTALILMPIFWPGVPPLSLAALKGFLISKDIPVDCYDLNNYFYNLVPDDIKNDWRKSCNRKLENGITSLLYNNYKYYITYIHEKIVAYDVAGFSVHQSNKKATISFIKELQKDERSPNIILGGPEITADYLEYGDELDQVYNGIKIDLFVVGEGEKPIYDYLRGERKGCNVVKYNELGKGYDWPLPDYSDFEFINYPRKNTASLMFTRGCIRKCSFCSERLLFKSFRAMPVENITNQMVLFKKKGITNYIFHDSMINGDLNALEELLDAIKEKFVSIPWEAQIGIRNDMPQRLFRKIKETGCYHLFVGLESGSDNVLSDMNKGFNVNMAKLFFEKLNEYKISFGVSIIAGYPGETPEDFIDCVDFLVNNKKLIPKIEQVNPFIKYRGISAVNEDMVGEDERLRRVSYLMKRIKEEKIKYTDAFIMNLTERD